MATRKSVTSLLPTQLIEYDAMYSPPPRTAVMPRMISGIQRISVSSLCTKVPSSSGFINAGSAISVNATITIPSSATPKMSRYGAIWRKRRQYSSVLVMRSMGATIAKLRDK